MVQSTCPVVTPCSDIRAWAKAHESLCSIFRDKAIILKKRPENRINHLVTVITLFPTLKFASLFNVNCTTFPDQDPMSQFATRYTWHYREASSPYVTGLMQSSKKICKDLKRNNLRDTFHFQTAWYSALQILFAIPFHLPDCWRQEQSLPKFAIAPEDPIDRYFVDCASMNQQND